jgi:hypothetical protein
MYFPDFDFISILDCAWENVTYIGSYILPFSYRFFPICDAHVGHYNWLVLMGVWQFVLWLK